MVKIAQDLKKLKRLKEGGGFEDFSIETNVKKNLKNCNNLKNMKDI